MPVIRSSERVGIFGRAGSGKTTWAKHLLRGVDRYVVLDPKHTYVEPGVPILREFKPKLDRQIIRVPFDAERERWYAVVESVWRAGNRILYADEFTLVNSSPNRLDETWGKAIRTGRERNVGVWLGQQRPKELPSAAFTESEHFFVFRLQFEADRDKVASFTGDAMSKALERIRGHQFVYYNVMADQLQVMELQLRKRKRAS